MNVLGRRHGDTPINRSPIPPGPKLERLCRLVELVAAERSKKTSSVNIARLACCACQDVASPGSVLPNKAERRAKFALGYLVILCVMLILIAGVLISVG